MKPVPTIVPLAEVRELESRRAAVERRLEDGYQRIEEAIVNGEDVTAWEEFWISLLAEYEALSDDLQAAA